MLQQILKQEDYFKARNIELSRVLSRLVALDNPSTSTDLFIKRIEDRCVDWLCANRSFNGVLDGDFQTECFKRGVIEQIDYALEVGELYKKENGEMYTLQEMTSFQICPQALNAFKVGGMANYRLFPNRI